MPPERPPRQFSLTRLFIAMGLVAAIVAAGRHWSWETWATLLILVLIVVATLVIFAAPLGRLGRFCRRQMRR